MNPDAPRPDGEQARRTPNSRAARPPDALRTSDAVLAPAPHGPSRAFLVTDHLSTPSAAELESLTRSFEHACRRLTATGTPVRLLTTTYLPTQQRWLGLFLANSQDDVRRATAIAQLASFSVTEV